MLMNSTLYLVPVTLAEVEHSRCLPEYNREVVRSIKHFIVENIRTARRFLKAADKSIDIDSLSFYELNKHTSPEVIASYLAPLSTGQDVAVLSEAGCPAVADPGSEIVAIAQSKGYKVVPLVGPSSILMALMGAGFNGQRFAFLGYLPIDDSERIKVIREAEHRAISLGETQIFIETPYRNERLVEDLIKHCKGTTKLCIASQITAPNELIRTRPLAEWKGKVPNIHKQPTIFVLGR